MARARYSVRRIRSRRVIEVSLQSAIANVREEARRQHAVVEA
jgi:hypothetical protein